MLQAAIFDLDGLMVDSEPLQSKAFELVIKAYGKTPMPHENGVVHIVGIRGDDNWKYLKEKYGIAEDIPVLREKRREIYSELLRENIKPMPGLLPLLKLLQEKGIKMAIASGSSFPHILPVVDALHLQHYFEAIVSGQEVEKGKPDPEIFLKAAERLGIKPEDCLVFEDTVTGVIAAKTAGMKAIAVPNEYTKGHDFSQADKVVNSLADVTPKTLSFL